MFCNRNKKRQRPASKIMYIYGFYLLVGKLGLHPEMVLSLACIIKLLNITIQMKTSLLMYAYFLLYVYLYVLCYSNWYFDTTLASSLNLANLHFLVIMLVATISTITFHLDMLFLTFGMYIFRKDFELFSNFILGHF